MIHDALCCSLQVAVMCRITHCVWKKAERRSNGHGNTVNHGRYWFDVLVESADIESMYPLDVVGHSFYNPPIQYTVRPYRRLVCPYVRCFSGWLTTAIKKSNSAFQFSSQQVWGSGFESRLWLFCVVFLLFSRACVGFSRDTRASLRILGACMFCTPHKIVHRGECECGCECECLLGSIEIYESEPQPVISSSSLSCLQNVGIIAKPNTDDQ